MTSNIGSCYGLVPSGITRLYTSCLSMEWFYEPWHLMREIMLPIPSLSCRKLLPPISLSWRPENSGNPTAFSTVLLAFHAENPPHLTDSHHNANNEENVSMAKNHVRNCRYSINDPSAKHSIYRGHLVPSAAEFSQDPTWNITTLGLLNMHQPVYAIMMVADAKSFKRCQFSNNLTNMLTQLWLNLNIYRVTDVKQSMFLRGQDVGNPLQWRQHGRDGISHH